MVNRIRKAMNERDQGFTLIELLVVIIVIGILAAIAIPVFLNQRKKGVDASIKADLRNAAESAESIAVENPLGKPADATTAFYTTGATGTTSMVAAGFKRSPGNVVTINGGPAVGFCLKATNPGASSTNTYYYDSLLGGYKGALAAAPAGGACIAAATTAGPDVTLP